MERVKLQVQLREDLSKSHLKAMRRRGAVPASLYGKAKTTVPLEVELKGLANALKSDAGIRTIMDLQIEGGKKSDGGTAYIKAIQRDPISRKVLHIDFERVSASDLIVIQVPVIAEGTAVGAKEGGIFEQLLDELEIRTRADSMLPQLEVDITNMGIGEFIYATDVTLPEGAELVTRPDDIVIAIRPPQIVKEEEEEVPAEEEAAPESPATEETED